MLISIDIYCFQCQSQKALFLVNGGEESLLATQSVETKCSSPNKKLMTVLLRIRKQCGREGRKKNIKCKTGRKTSKHYLLGKPYHWNYGCWHWVCTRVVTNSKAELEGRLRGSSSPLQNYFLLMNSGKREPVASVVNPPMKAPDPRGWFLLSSHPSSPG